MMMETPPMKRSPLPIGRLLKQCLWSVPHLPTEVVVQYCSFAPEVFEWVSTVKSVNYLWGEGRMYDVKLELGRW